MDFKPYDRIKYEIYQMKLSEANRGIQFLSYETVMEMKPDLSLDDYDLKYSGTYNIGIRKTMKDILDGIYCVFNYARPSDFKGHSLSVSDIIRIEDKYYYVNSYGFVELKG